MPILLSLLERPLPSLLHQLPSILVQNLFQFERKSFEQLIESHSIHISLLHNHLEVEQLLATDLKKVLNLVQVNQYQELDTKHNRFPIPQSISNSLASEKCLLTFAAVKAIPEKAYRSQITVVPSSKWAKIPFLSSQSQQTLQ